MTDTVHDRDQQRLTARRHLLRLANEDIAHKLVTLAELPRSLNPVQRYALLVTAASRLQDRARRIGAVRTLRADASIVDGFGPLTLHAEWMSGELPATRELPDGGRWEITCGAGLGSGTLRLLKRTGGGATAGAAAPTEADLLGTLRYRRAADGALTLEGTFDGHAITVEGTLRRPEDFLLMNRGFHWINEYPFNR